MSKEQQIEELTMLLFNKAENYCNADGEIIPNMLADTLYNAGYRKVPKGSFVCSESEANLDIEVCNNCGMQQANELFERDKEIDRLKVVNERFVNNMKNVLIKNILMKTALEIEKENAVKEFAEHLKKYAIKANSPAWGLMKFVEVSDIDKLLKEYEK